MAEDDFSGEMYFFKWRFLGLIFHLWCLFSPFLRRLESSVVKTSGWRGLSRTRVCAIVYRRVHVFGYDVFIEMKAVFADWFFRRAFTCFMG